MLTNVVRLAVVLTAISALVSGFPSHDLSTYYAAGLFARQGQLDAVFLDPTAHGITAVSSALHALTGGHQGASVPAFLSMPSVVPLLAPFGERPYWNWVLGWRLVAGFAVMVAYELTLVDRKGHVPTALALLAALPAAWYGIVIGQSTFVVALAAALAAARQDRVGGAVLAVAVGFKALPAALIVPWAAGRRRAALVTFAVVTALLVALSLALYPSSAWGRFVAGAARFQAVVAPERTNASIEALWLHVGGVHQMNFVERSAAARWGGLAATAGVLALAWRRRSVALGLLPMLLSPQVWLHYHVLLPWVLRPALDAGGVWRVLALAVAAASAGVLVTFVAWAGLGSAIAGGFVTLVTVALVVAAEARRSPEP